jgi:hypothetical protein
MGLKETLQKGASTAFKALGNLKIDGTFMSSDTVYNPTTGTVSDKGSSYTVSMVRSYFSKYEDSKQDNAPRIGDFKLKVLSSDIPDPKLIDKVVIDDVTFNIIGFIIDPADAVYEFHTRAIQ